MESNHASTMRDTSHISTCYTLLPASPNLTSIVQQTAILHVRSNAVSPPIKSTSTFPAVISPPLTPYLFLRAALKIPKSTDILDHIHSLPEPAQSEAQAAIRSFESAAMIEQEPQPGLNELITYLEGKGVRMALCTRNFEYVVSFVSISISCLTDSISQAITLKVLMISFKRSSSPPPHHLPPHLNLLPNRNARLPPPQTLPSRNPTHRRTMGPRR